MTGKEIKKQRKKRNMTQLDLSTYLKCTQAYLSLIENGKRPIKDYQKERLYMLFGKPERKTILRKSSSRR